MDTGLKLYNYDLLSRARVRGDRARKDYEVKDVISELGLRI